MIQETVDRIATHHPFLAGNGQNLRIGQVAHERLDIDIAVLQQLERHRYHLGTELVRPQRLRAEGNVFVGSGLAFRDDFAFFARAVKIS